MSEKITFYHNPMSRARVAHWMLEEVGADYETVLLDWKKGEHKSEAFLKLNPMGKLPTIVHRGVVITETPAICMYLADAFPKAGLAPALDSLDRGPYLRWFFFVAGCFEAAMMDLHNPRTQKVEPSRAGHGTAADTFKALELAVSKGYVAGSKFTAADLFIASSLGFGMFSQQIEPKPVFLDYVKRCQDRPAFKRASDKDGHM